MREWVYDCWNHIMDAEVNPLRHIPDLQVRHMIMQICSIYVVKCICYCYSR